MARRVSRNVLVRSFNRSLGEVELRLRDREPERLGANNEEVPRWTWLITPSKTSPQGSLRFNDGDGSRVDIQSRGNCGTTAFCARDQYAAPAARYWLHPWGPPGA